MDSLIDFVLMSVLLIVFVTSPSELFAEQKNVNWEKLTPEQAANKWQSRKSEAMLRYEQRISAQKKADRQNELRELEAQKGTVEIKRQYQELNSLFEQNRAKKKKTREEARKHLAEKRKECLRLKDKLKDYEVYRTRWYKLDEEGNRVYLSADEIDQDRRFLVETIHQHCSQINS